MNAPALFAVGTGITLVAGKSVRRSRPRRSPFGLIAAALTFGIGTLLGAAITG